MIATETKLEDCTLNVTQEIRVEAPIDVTFDALLEQIGPANETPDGRKMPMKLEPWPGGRWFRDLGDNNGHFWASVQAIKRPTLLEFAGPLMMSYPVANNVQYRLREEDGGTVIQFHHTGFGLIHDDHRRGVVSGWSFMNDQARLRAERIAAKR
ncbi:MAG TPA: SRPBCC domain-containing protein [Acidobacteriaceae bacterium]|nr:SRPBCC domain-containing protein [Acidobacteriaceae bacterium]